VSFEDDIKFFFISQTASDIDFSIDTARLSKKMKKNPSNMYPMILSLIKEGFLQRTSKRKSGYEVSLSEKLRNVENCKIAMKYFK